MNELARRVGDSPETINLIVRGDTKRCRSRRLKRIARAIGCTDLDYLMGKTNHLQNARYHVKRDVGGRAQRAPDGALILEEDLEDPTETQLAQAEFLGPCRESITVDFQPQSESDNEWRVVHLLLARLIDPKGWRRQLTDRGQPMSEEEQTEATEALARAFGIVLRPWLTAPAGEALEIEELARLLGVGGETLEQAQRVAKRVTAIDHGAWVAPKPEQPDATKATTEKRKPR